MKLTHTWKSYVRVLLFGAVMGILTELLNFFPYNDLWGWSSIAGSFVFWIFSTTFVIYFSSSNRNAMFNTFLYLGGMCVSYYVLQGIVDFLTPNVTVDNYLQWSHLFFWLAIAAGCSLVAYVLYFWNRDTVYGSALCALPVAGMLVDTLNNCMKFYYSHTNLANSIFGVVGLGIMLVVLFKKSRRKGVFSIVCVTVAILGILFFPGSSQAVTTEATMTCTLNGETEVYYIKMRDDGKILELKGDEAVYAEIGIDTFQTIPEVIHALQAYFESNGGTWEFE